MNHKIVTPQAPKIVLEENNKGIYEIDNLYPGYGHTLGNSLRRIIHSSVPGVAVTSLSIEGVPHEFSTIDGIIEDVITIILNLKRVNFEMDGNDPQTISLEIKGEKKVTAADIKYPSQIKILNKDAHIAELTTKNASLKMEMTLEKGIGYAPKEARLKNEKAKIGDIVLDADFTPIRRVKYEVENMRVGDRTDYNRLRLHIETDGTVSPKEVFLTSIETMIEQLKAMQSFGGIPYIAPKSDFVEEKIETREDDSESGDLNTKIKVDDLPLSSRTVNALLMAGVKTVAGLIRKTEEDILDLEGIGAKGVDEIKEALANLNLELKAKK
jgi:DNA-directed RNA polymerase subunit alpha